MCSNKQTLCQPPLCPLRVQKSPPTCPEHNKSLSPDTYTEPTSNLCATSAPLTIYQTPTPHSSSTPPPHRTQLVGQLVLVSFNVLPTPPAIPSFLTLFYRFHKPPSASSPSPLLLLCPLQDRQLKDPLKMSTCMDEHADGGFFSSLFYELIARVAGATSLQQTGTERLLCLREQSLNTALKSWKRHSARIHLRPFHAKRLLIFCSPDRFIPNQRRGRTGAGKHHKSGCAKQ